MPPVNAPPTSADDRDPRRIRRALYTAAVLLWLGGRPWPDLPPALPAVVAPLLLTLATTAIFVAFAHGARWRDLYLPLAFWGLISLGWLIPLDRVFGPALWLAVTSLIVLWIPPVGWLLRRLYLRWGLGGFLWWAPLAWAGWEWLRSFPPTGVPWFSLGHGLWQTPILCQIAEVTGVAGLSLVLCVVGAGLARVALLGRREVLQLGVGLGMVVGLAVYGQARLAQLARPAGEPWRVACVQPNIPLADKVGLSGWDLLFDTLELTREVPAGTDLVVWPETATVLYIDEPPAWPYISQAAREGEFVLAAGGFHRTRGRGWPEPKTNAAVVVEPQGTLAGVYSKVRLVLFGEYLPARSSRLVYPLARHTPQFFAGRGFYPVRTSLGELGVAICYESVFPRDCAALVRAGAEVLVVMTNDDQLSRTGALEHYYQAVFRAIETRRWVVRCANSGVSAVIDPAGRPTTESRWHERTVLSGEVYPRTGQTPLVRWGDWFGGLLLALALGAALWPGAGRAREESER